MTNNTAFLALSEDQVAAVTGGGFLAGLFGSVGTVIVTAIINECVTHWADVTAGMSQGSAAAKTAY